MKYDKNIELQEKQKAQERKYSIFLIFALCLLFLGQASAWTSSDYSEQPEPYGTYEITESRWYDPLGIWTDVPIEVVTLESNTDSCLTNCYAIKNITTYKEMPLITDFRTYRIYDDGSRELAPIRSYSFKIWDNPLNKTVGYYENVCNGGYTDEETGIEVPETCNMEYKEKLVYYKLVDNYKTECIDGEFNEVNQSYNQVCSQVLDGQVEEEYDGWRNYNIGDTLPAGNYIVKLEGNKRAEWTYDWQVKLQNEWTTKWAVWGVSDLTTDLVAHYKLNSQNFATSNQTTVIDSTGINNGTLVGKTFNDGTVSGGVTIEDGAMKFDGVDDSVQINSVNLGDGWDEITLSSWIYIENWINYGGILSARNLTTSDYTGLNIRNSIDRNVSVYIDLGATLSYATSSAIQTGQWYHLVGTWKSGEVPIIYINGQEDVMVNGPAVTGTISQKDYFQIGWDKSVSGGNKFFNGSIDEVLIFNRALSQDEITQLYNQGRGQYSSVTDGLVAQYSGRDFAGTEASPTTIYDTNHLGDGKILESLSFDGSKYVESPANINNSLFNQSGTYTVSNWFKLSEIPSGGDKSIWNFQDGGSNRISLMVQGSSTVGFQRYNGSAYTNIRIADTTLETNRWYHVVAISENGNLDLYFDGEIANVRTDNLYTPLGNSNKFRLGFASTLKNAYSINGSIDDVRIYNRSLSADEISYLYNSGLGREDDSNAFVVLNSPANDQTQYTREVTTNSSAYVSSGAYLVNASLNVSVNGGAWEIRNTTNLTIGVDGLVSYYTLDETSGTTAFDTVGSNHGTNNGATVNQAGKIDKAYSFDGSNDYISIGDIYNEKISLSFWVRDVPNSMDVQNIISKDIVLVNGKREYTTEYTNNRISFYVWTTGGAFAQVVLPYSPSNSSWTHVVFTFNGTHLASYRDGNLVNLSAHGSPGNILNTDTPLEIGRGQSESYRRYFGGKLDEVGIWSRALNSTEITALYNSGAGSRPTTTTTTTTTTFTNTFNAGDVVDFNYEFCDTDGDCGQSETRRFTIDGTAPTISLNYPTALIDYGRLNGTLELNFTATDTNLDSVWYNYNGTNVTIAGAVSGVYNVSNITLSNKKNVTIYANDTAGNLNATTFNWDYKVFENSRSFTTPIVETSLDTFIINVTSGLSLSSVYLNYNGTEYPTSLSGGVYTKQLTIPAITQDSTMQVSWRFVYDGTNITSEITNQTVSKLIFNICNATINNTLINFTTKSATNPFPIVNSTFKSSWMLSASVGATPTNFTYEDIAGNKSSYSFCTNTNTTTIYTAAEVEYDGTEYALNFYYLDDINLTATNPQNISLYLLNDSLATVTILKVVSASQQPQPDHQINIQSYDVGTGTFYLVGMAKTNFNGEDVVYLNWFDTLYKFIVLDEDGEVVKTTGTTKISASPTTIELENEITFPYDKFEDFVYSLYYENTTSNFVLTYTKPSGEVDKACLRVYKHGSGNDTLVCDECETSASATLFCNVASYGNGTYVGLFYATGSFSLVDWIYEYVGGTFQTTIYNLLGNEDASFYAFLFAGLITVALFINAVFGIIALMIGLIGASALGFTALQWGQMTGVIIIGGFIVWLLKR